MPVIKQEVDRAYENEGFARARCPKNKITGETCSSVGHCPFDREHKGAKCKCDAMYRGPACERKRESDADKKVRAAKEAAVEASTKRAEMQKRLEDKCKDAKRA